VGAIGRGGEGLDHGDSRDAPLTVGGSSQGLIPQKLAGAELYVQTTPETYIPLGSDLPCAAPLRERAPMHTSSYASEV
jgi:hypothetical protein